MTHQRCHRCVNVDKPPVRFRFSSPVLWVLSLFSHVSWCSQIRRCEKNCSSKWATGSPVFDLHKVPLTKVNTVMVFHPHLKFQPSIHRKFFPSWGQNRPLNGQDLFILVWCYSGFSPVIMSCNPLFQCLHPIYNHRQFLSHHHYPRVVERPSPDRCRTSQLIMAMILRGYIDLSCCILFSSVRYCACFSK